MSAVMSLLDSTSPLKRTRASRQASAGLLLCSLVLLLSSAAQAQPGGPPPGSPQHRGPRPSADRSLADQQEFSQVEFDVAVAAQSQAEADFLEGLVTPLELLTGQNQPGFESAGPTDPLRLARRGFLVQNQGIGASSYVDEDFDRFTRRQTQATDRPRGTRYARPDASI